MADQSANDMEVCDGLSISWTMAAPDAPAVIFVPGRGQVDRNGNYPEFHPSMPVFMTADLIAAGINVLVFDKRDVGKSLIGSGKPWDLSTIDDEAKDVQCLMNWVRENKNPLRLTLIGYNDGGIVAALAASTGDPQAIVMLPRYDLRISEYPESLRAAGLGKAAVEEIRNAVSVELGGGRPELKQPILQRTVDTVLAFIRLTRAPVDRDAIVAALKIPILMIGADDDLQSSKTGFLHLSRQNPRIHASFVANLNQDLRLTSPDCNDVCQRRRKPLGNPLDRTTVSLIAGFVGCGSENGTQDCSRDPAATAPPGRP